MLSDPVKAMMPDTGLSHQLLTWKSCLWEATARKVGNVHPRATFADTTYVDFYLSAAALAAAWEQPAQHVGEIVWQGVQRTKQVVGKNTNLGIILLLAPFIQCGEHGPLREKLQKVLAELDAEHDARRVFEAIRATNPGGLGEASEQDVRDEPTVTLLEAMTLAADRDLVARQYASGYAGVFDFGVPALLEAYDRFTCVEAAVIACQFQWLATYPDSLIARKKGNAVADDVRQRAREVLQLGGIASIEGRRAGVELDRFLRSEGNRLNPGTTADLITACLFVALRENKLEPSAPFRWHVNDWL